MTFQLRLKRPRLPPRSLRFVEEIPVVSRGKLQSRLSLRRFASLNLNLVF